MACNSPSYHKIPGKPKRICVLDDVNESAFKALNDSHVVFEKVNEYIAIHLAVNESSILFILEDFHGKLFEIIDKSENWILGPTAVIEYCSRKLPLIPRKNPVYSLSMDNYKFFISLKEDKDLTVRLMKLIRFMGGSIRAHIREMTHFISNTTLSNGYRYASLYNLPVLTPGYVEYFWDTRRVPGFNCSNNILDLYRLKIFAGVYICFLNFPPEEQLHRILLEANCGAMVELNDPLCTHVVVDEFNIDAEIAEMQNKIVVHSEWFWTCIQQEWLVNEEPFTYYMNSEPMSTSSLEISTTLTKPEMDFHRNESISHEYIFPHLRYSSGGNEDNKIGIFNNEEGMTHGNRTEGSPRTSSSSSPEKENLYRNFLIRELIQTENNYVGILKTILQIQSMAADEKQRGGALINQIEMRNVFSYFEELAAIHKQILAELVTVNVKRIFQIAEIFIKYKEDLMKYYPKFSEGIKDAQKELQSLESTRPRFSAFLEIWKKKPACGREQLKDLLVRPIQRIGSISLLLKELQKSIPEDCPNAHLMETAIKSLQEIMKLMNDDVVQTEKFRSVFYVYNMILDCPVTLVSSQRNLLMKFIGQDLTGELASQGDCVAFFLFTDILEVCKLREKVAAAALKGMTNENDYQKMYDGIPYKHIKLLSMTSVRRVINIEDTNEVKNSFALVVRQIKARDTVCCFRYLSMEDISKEDLIIRIAKYLANNESSGDVNKYWTSLPPHETDNRLQTSKIPRKKGIHKLFSPRLLSPRN